MTSGATGSMVIMTSCRNKSNGSETTRADGVFGPSSPRAMARVTITSITDSRSPSALATVPFAVAGPGTNQWWLGAVLLVRGFTLVAALASFLLPGRRPAP